MPSIESNSWAVLSVLTIFVKPLPQCFVILLSLYPSTYTGLTKILARDSPRIKFITLSRTPSLLIGMEPNTVQSKLTLCMLEKVLGSSLSFYLGLGPVRNGMGFKLFNTFFFMNRESLWEKGKEE